MTNSFSRTLFSTLAGPIIWALHFLFIYSFNGVVCARLPLYNQLAKGWGTSWVIIAASLLALVAMLLIYLRQRPHMPRTDEPGFFPGLAGMLSLLSAVAIVWETIPVLLLSPCAQ